MKNLKLLFLTAFVALSATVSAQSVKIKWKQIQTGTSGQIAIVGVDGLGHWVTPPFLNISDTAAMLAAYQTQINARVKYTDTAAMLAAYQTAINLRVKYTDTAAMLSAYQTAINARVKYTDTAAMLANYATAINARVKYSDTAAMLSPYEHVSNKAADLSVSNTTLYATTKAAKDNDISALAVTGTTTKTITATRPNGNITATWTDDNTTYTAGYGLSLSGTTISADTTKLVPLDAGGKIPINYFPATLMIYKGVWNVATNTPTLADGTGTTGWVYKITGAATTGTARNLGSGSITFYNGDWVIYNGTSWERSDNSDLVTSVNGQQGVVSLTTTDIPQGTNLYFTNALARAALSNGTGIGYSSSTGVISNTAPNVQSNLALGTVTATTQPITNSDGTGFTLPAATTSAAGLMSAADKTTITNLDGTYIKQGGNSFGTTLSLGTNDNNSISFKINGTQVGGINTSGFLNIPYVQNSVSFNNSNIGLGNSGTVVSRNIADGNPALIVSQTNASSTGNIQSWLFNAGLAGYMTTAGQFGIGSVSNLTTASNALITPSANGTVISRNVADVNPALVVNKVISGSGPIQQWQTAGTTMALVDNNGYGRFSRMGIGSPLFSPSYLLDVNAGNVASTAPLAQFSQNGGTFIISDGSSVSGNYVTALRSTIAGADSTTGMYLLANGANGYSLGAFTLIAKDRNGTGNVTSGNLLNVRNNNTSYLSLSYNGILTVPSLAGTGTRMVTADASGNVSTQALPATFTLVQAAEQFTGSTANTITLGHAPSSSAHLSVSLNGQWLTASDFGAVSTTLTLSNVSRETDDVILVYYSY